MDGGNVCRGLFKAKAELERAAKRARVEDMSNSRVRPKATPDATLTETEPPAWDVRLIAQAASAVRSHFAGRRVGLVLCCGHRDVKEARTGAQRDLWEAAVQQPDFHVSLANGESVNMRVFRELYASLRATERSTQLETWVLTNNHYFQEKLEVDSEEILQNQPDLPRDNLADAMQAVQVSFTVDVHTLAVTPDWKTHWPARRIDRVGQRALHGAQTVNRAEARRRFCLNTVRTHFRGPWLQALAAEPPFDEAKPVARLREALNARAHPEPVSRWANTDEVMEFVRDQLVWLADDENLALYATHLACAERPWTREFATDYANKLLTAHDGWYCFAKDQTPVPQYIINSQAFGTIRRNYEKALARFERINNANAEAAAAPAP